MTRRKFIQKIIAAGSAIFVGASLLIKNVAPRKFIRAIRQKNYPGPVRPLGDISKQGKWSG